MAKNSLERYTHYYERWSSNQTLAVDAKGYGGSAASADAESLACICNVFIHGRRGSDRRNILRNNRFWLVLILCYLYLTHLNFCQLEKLSEIQCTPESLLNFILEAWLQIIECRLVLKWTYAYGYYLPDHERAKRQFFEYLQGEAESGLERLHQCVEKDLVQFLNADGPSKDFNDFRTKLAGLTSVTKNYFENLVKALENGLADVDSHAACSSKSTSSKSTGCSSKTRGKGKGSCKTGGSGI